MTAPEVRCGIGLWLAITMLGLAACSPGDDGVGGFTPPPVPETELGAVARNSIEAARAEVEAAPDDPQVLGAYAMLLQAYGYVGDADAIYRHLRAVDDDPRWPRFHGLILLDRGEAAAAEDAFRAADPGGDAIVMEVYRARALIADGRDQAAMDILRAVIAGHPERVDALLAAAGLAMSAGDPAASADYYSRALQQVPGLKPAHYGLAQALRARGMAETAAGQMQAFESAPVESYTPEDDPRRQIAALVVSDSRHVQRARRALAGGDYEGAKAELEAARALNPGNLSTLTNLIAVYGRLRQPEQATDAYQAALSINADYYQAHFNYGVVMAYLGRPREAERAFRAAAAADPARPEPYVEHGRMLEGAGQGALAAEQFRQALDIDAGNVPARFLLGRQLALSGQPDQAIWHLEQATASDDPGVPAMMRVLAGVYGQAGDAAKARLTLQAARDRARELGQTDLAEQIDRDLARLPAG
ncbi:MAG: tetratricopeptide repeat protein [Gammaproteobacteria bacterium]|jgi:Tfp pilus assembly protein PilF